MSNFAQSELKRVLTFVSQNAKQAAHRPARGDRQGIGNLKLNFNGSTVHRIATQNPPTFSTFVHCDEALERRTASPPDIQNSEAN
jgi:hypothetical protein